jgi:hypothetical protein
MHPPRLRRPSAALVVSTIALIVALGGTSYAAMTLPLNSVGTKQLKNGAVTTKKLAKTVTVSNALHADHASSADAATSANHANSAHNAVTASSATNASRLGGTPASGYLKFGSTLPSGSTETGVFAVGGGDSTNGYAVTGIRFYPSLAGALNEQHTIFTTSTTAHCSGPGQADPGYLCVYGPTLARSNVSFNSIGSGSGTSGASPSGAALFFGITGPGSYAQGYWAVTAP